MEKRLVEEGEMEVVTYFAGSGNGRSVAAAGYRNIRDQTSAAGISFTWDKSSGSCYVRERPVQRFLEQDRQQSGEESRGRWSPYHVSSEIRRARR